MDLASREWLQEQAVERIGCCVEQIVSLRSQGGSPEQLQQIQRAISQLKQEIGHWGCLLRWLQTQ